jgi:hypothetical protein
LTASKISSMLQPTGSSKAAEKLASGRPAFISGELGRNSKFVIISKKVCSSAARSALSSLGAVRRRHGRGHPGEQPFDRFERFALLVA